LKEVIFRFFVLVRVHLLALYVSVHDSTNVSRLSIHFRTDISHVVLRSVIHERCV
jgi:hypothetical protein